ncbi:MAG: CPXCG motif-containing cysteine-rich protein [Thiolinea sp.]
MPQALVYQDVTCPYCYSSMTTAIDISSGTSQDYYEDCQVCCAPMELRVQLSDDGQIEMLEIMPGNG